MKNKVFAVIGVVCAVIGLSFFIFDNESNPEKNEVHDIKELVNKYSVGDIKNQTASITSHQLIVTDSDGSQLSYDLPENDFFVSIAPYVNETHT